MSEGIPAVGRRNTSIHLWLWGDPHSIVLSTLISALLLFTACTLVPTQFVTKRLLGSLYEEIQRSAVKTAG